MEDDFFENQGGRSLYEFFYVNPPAVSRFDDRTEPLDPQTIENMTDPQILRRLYDIFGV